MPEPRPLFAILGSQPGEGRWSAQVQVAAEHPALQGHFAGSPVVPGVFQLDFVLGIARQLQWLHEGEVQLESVKFKALLLPCACFELVITQKAKGCSFDARQGETVYSQGNVKNG